MKLEPETIFVLPDGSLTTGERIIRALTLEERLLNFAKEGETDG